jgi:hypothetical protein
MSVIVASVILTVAPASGQTGTTTTVDPLSTTTVDPLSTTTTVDPLSTTTTVDPLSTTTVAPLSTTTTTLNVQLPGEAINIGTMSLGAQLRAKPTDGCAISGSLAGQQMNLVRTETGNIGAVYGKAQMGNDTAGMLMVEIGPLPMALIVYRSVGTCNQDVLGIGGFSASPTSANFSGIGFAAYPGDFAKYVMAHVDVGNSGGTPNLDVQAAEDFLTAKR